MSRLKTISSFVADPAFHVPIRLIFSPTRLYLQRQSVALESYEATVCIRELLLFRFRPTTVCYLRLISRFLRRHAGCQRIKISHRGLRKEMLDFFHLFQLILRMVQ